MTWVGAATRVAKNLGVTQRADVKEIVDAANAETAVLRNEVIGTQEIDILRDPTRLSESAMGNLVADAMIGAYPGIDAALTNSGGLRADILGAPPSGGEAVDEITWGEVFAVLPFGNRTVIETLTGEQLHDGAGQRVLARLRPRHRHRPLPAGGRAAGCASTARHDGRGGLDRDVVRPGGSVTPIGPADTGPARHQRLHVRRR